MSTAPDPYGYRMVPLDVVTEIGKVTVVAAHVEADLYRIGDMCEVDKARAMPATQLANVLAQRVRDKALPECLEDLTPALLRGTAGAVPVLKERHEVIHGAISFERTTEHDWRATSRRSKEDAKKRLVAVERLVAQRQELERVATALTPVWVALLMDGRGPLIKAVDIEFSMAHDRESLGSPQPRPRRCRGLPHAPTGPHDHTLQTRAVGAWR